MSPEQVQGLDTDHRTDIFSLGVVLYELFAGESPFKGVHETAITYEIVNVVPTPPSTVKPDIDPQLDALIMECLEKEPSERYQAVGEISKALRRIKRESGQQNSSRIMPVQPVPRAGGIPGVRRAFWPLLCGVLAIALMAVAWLWYRSGSNQQTPVRLSITLPRDETTSAQIYSSVAISPDGTTFVYRIDNKLYKRSIDSFTPELLPGTEGGVNPFFSPDGRWVAFSSANTLKKVALSGGLPIVLVSRTANRGGEWSKTGKIIFPVDVRGGLISINDDGSNPVQLTAPDSTKNERTHRTPHLLPDGKSVLFTVGSMDSPDYYEDATIDCVDIETGARKTVLQGASSAFYVKTGHLIYAHAGTLYAVPFDLSTKSVSGTASPVVENVSGDRITGTTDVTVAENGTLAYVPGTLEHTKRAIARIDLNGTITTLPAPIQPYMEPRVSPDGKHVAVVVAAEKDYDIWIYGMVDHSMRRFTFGGLNHSPLWSPDGRKIAYSSNISGNPKVIIRDADGGGNTEEIPSTYDHTYLMSWSKDGSFIVLVGIRYSSGGDILVLPLSGDRRPWAYADSKFDESSASLSPDGRWLAYISNESGNDQLYVRPFPRGEGKWQLSADNGFSGIWAPDGKSIVYQNYDGLKSLPIDGSRSMVVGNPTSFAKGLPRVLIESRRYFDFSPDGKYLLYTKPVDGDESLKQINVIMNWFDEVRQKTGANR
jgi:Tol biopolymer transport system component